MKVLPKTDSTRQRQLIQLSRDINAREETLMLLRSKTIDAANNWMCEVILQGDALNQAKASLPHGMWLDWLRIHCPLLSNRQASKYMLISRNRPRGTDLNEAVSIRAALALCEEQASPAPVSETKSWPPYLEALGRIAKFATALNKNPIADWPPEGRDKLRTDLTPIARELWPDKFQA